MTRMRAIFGSRSNSAAPVRGSGQSVIEDEFDLDVGIFRKKPHRARPEDRIGRVLARRDVDGSLRASQAARSSKVASLAP
jgi:hypothetical protein